MQSQILVYGLPRGETRDFMEQLLAANCRTPADIDAVKSAATSQGWHSIRVTTWDGSPPNFAKTVG